MRLPGGERAVVPLSRVTGYLLSPDHPVGKHKARVFLAALGLDRAAAHVLQTWLQDLARTGDARLGRLDPYGQRFAIVGELHYNERSARIRTAWIVRTGNTDPEFLTAIVLE